MVVGRNQVDHNVTDIRQTADTLSALLDHSKRDKEVIHAPSSPLTRPLAIPACL